MYYLNHNVLHLAPELSCKYINDLPMTRNSQSKHILCADDKNVITANIVLF